jgi:hemerythrin
MAATEKYPWKPEYAVGVEAVDRQHQEFFRIVNQLHAASGGRNADKEAREALDGLINYACYHFVTEEELLLEAGVPAAEMKKHAEIHQIFVNKIKELRDAMWEGKAFGHELAEFTVQWLVEHVANVDVKYARKIRKKPA